MRNDASQRGAERSGNDGSEGIDVADRPIGSLIADTRSLTPDQVERILQHQKAKGLLFGQAAIELGFATEDDVMFALAQQFHYPYAPDGSHRSSAELVALNDPFSPKAETFRSLRSQVLSRVFADPTTKRALAILSTDAGDGKSFLSANLAVSLAQLGSRTLLIDADMRGPRQHDIFGLPGEVGLSGILNGRTESRVIHQVTAVPSLFVLPVGVRPPNPLELVERPAFGLLMRELIGKFDHVIVDTPASCYGSDCGVIASRAGAALVVARRNTCRMNQLRGLVRSMESGPVRLAGVVFNQF